MSPPALPATQDEPPSAGVPGHPAQGVPAILERRRERMLGRAPVVERHLREVGPGTDDLLHQRGPPPGSRRVEFIQVSKPRLLDLLEQRTGCGCSAI